MACASQTLVVLSFALAAQGQQQPQQRPQQQTVTELQKAVEEFRVQTRALGLRAESASQGKTAKSGSTWHGRLFENFRNNFLDAVPRDVMDGAPLRYRRTAEGGFVIWSIGWDRYDDGGDSEPAKITRIPPDWVWRS